MTNATLSPTSRTFELSVFLPLNIIWTSQSFFSIAFEACLSLITQPFSVSALRRCANRAGIATTRERLAERGPLRLLGHAGPNYRIFGKRLRTSEKRLGFRGRESRDSRSRWAGSVTSLSTRTFIEEFDHFRGSRPSAKDLSGPLGP